MSFFSLTDDLIATVCSDWLGVEKLNDFDIACANHRLRAQYVQAVHQGKQVIDLSFFSEETFSFPQDPKLHAMDKLMFLWRLGYTLPLRKVHCNALALHTLLSRLSTADRDKFALQLVSVVIEAVDCDLSRNVLSFLVDKAASDEHQQLLQLKISYVECGLYGLESLSYDEVCRIYDSILLTQWTFRWI